MGTAEQRGALVLGIDVGTGSLKAMVCDERGITVARAARSYPTDHPRPGLSEQDPQDWWRAMVAAVRELSAEVCPERIVALALSTQGGTLVPVGRSGAPATAAIVWTDRRCDREFAEVSAAMPGDEVQHRSGWGLTQGMNLLQVRRIERHEPELAERTAKYLSVHDYLVVRLTGRPVLDPSNAGINQLGDVRTGGWDDDLLAQAGIQADRLGELAPAGTLIGPLLPQVAAELGLPAHVVVVNGAHDQDCVALGFGATGPGELFIGSGTAWAIGSLLTSAEEGFARRQAVSRYVLPGLFLGLWTVTAGGSSLQWWREVASAGGELLAFDQLVARPSSAIASLPLFFPYLSGSPFPHPSPRSRGVFWGLEEGHRAGDLAGAVMAGVSLQVAAMVATLDRPAASVTLAGGAASSAVWPGYLASALGVPVRTAAEPDLGARGAALLAAIGVGLLAPSQVEPVVTTAVVEPCDQDEWVAANTRFRDLARVITQQES